MKALAVTSCVLVAVLIALWSPAGIIANAVSILVASLLGFHFAAWLSHEHKVAWQILDYALELITVVSLVAANSSISEAACPAPPRCRRAVPTRRAFSR